MATAKKSNSDTWPQFLRPNRNGCKKSVSLECSKDSLCLLSRPPPPPELTVSHSTHPTRLRLTQRSGPSVVRSQAPPTLKRLQTIPVTVPGPAPAGASGAATGGVGGNPNLSLTIWTIPFVPGGGRRSLSPTVERTHEETRIRNMESSWTAL